MLPQSHVHLAHQLSDKLDPKYKNYFVLGNITPDFALEHKIKKHEYDYLKDWFLNYLDKTLEMKLGDKRLAYYRLGVVTHYLADFFCRPHNDDRIKKKYLKHFAYEKTLHHQLLNYDFGYHTIGNTSLLKIDQVLEEQHAMYLERTYQPRHDLLFIDKLTSSVVNSACNYITENTTPTVFDFGKDCL